MKLTYRGNAYKISDSVQLGSNDQPQIKLIYRGHTYYTTLRSKMISEIVASDSSTITLIYRGNTYERRVQLSEPYQHPRAINWRYRMP